MVNTLLPHGHQFSYQMVSTWSPYGHIFTTKSSYGQYIVVTWSHDHHMVTSWSTQGHHVLPWFHGHMVTWSIHELIFKGPDKIIWSHGQHMVFCLKVLTWSPVLFLVKSGNQSCKTENYFMYFQKITFLSVALLKGLS